MGNAESSGAGGATLTTARKTCYYELLSVERSATQEEIKKAYKRKAFELHPDKNYNDIERATKLFAEVQAAYEVLSDPQERAWYDSHREGILHGRDPHTGAEGGGGGNGNGNGNGSGSGSGHGYTAFTTSEEILSWFTLFPSKSKIDYSDSAAGFYTVLSSTFAKLAYEERSAAANQGLEEPNLPSFGGSKSEYKDHVKKFYHHWTNFKTVKDFAWYDVYRLSDAPDRRIRRAMKKENERLRHEAKREYEDNIRELVKFVRKRDPRYTPQAPKTEAERRAENLAKSKEQAAKARAANVTAQKEYKPTDWTWVAPDEEGFNGSEEEEEEEQEDILAFECVACKKTFKAEGQLGAHEKSKKHRQVVWQLKKKMEKENKELGLSTEVSEDEEEWEEGNAGNVGGEQIDDSKGAKGSEVKEGLKVQVVSEERPSTKLSAKLQPKKAQDDENEGEEEGEEEEEEEEEDKDEDEDEAEAEDDEANDGPLASSLAETSLEDKKAQPQPPKFGKAKAKREKKKAAAVAAVAAAANGSGTPVTENTCAVCKDQFPSKTKMFTHLKENPSHVAALSQVKGNVGSSGSGGSSGVVGGRGKKAKAKGKRK